MNRKELEELEELTENFLREHDEYFLKKNKVKLMDYPYLSTRQQEYRKSREIPSSNLTNNQKLQCPKLNEPLRFY